MFNKVQQMDAESIMLCAKRFKQIRSLPFNCFFDCYAYKLSFSLNHVTYMQQTIPEFLQEKRTSLIHLNILRYLLSVGDIYIETYPHSKYLILGRNSTSIRDYILNLAYRVSTPLTIEVVCLHYRRSDVIF